MKSIKIVLFCIFVMLSVPAKIQAQKINVALPEFGNLKYSLVLSKGLMSDTIISGTFNFVGIATLTIPETYKDHVGIGVLKIENKPSINLVLNKENFSIQSKDGKYIFKNSPENEYFYSIVQDKARPESNDDLYASRFMSTMQYMNELNKVIYEKSSDLASRARVRHYALNSLDVDGLYTSGLWFYVIDGFTRLQGSNQEILGKDLIKLMDRVKSDIVFEALANDLIIIMNQYGWDTAFDIIVPHMAETGRIPYPQGNLFTAFTLAKLRKGMDVPAIEGLKTPIHSGDAAKTILFFYESDCPGCLTEIQSLISHYENIKLKNVRLIAISADHDEDNFNKLAKTFPWTEVLFNPVGFGAKTFTDYGILGTPTFFLLDKDKKIIGRYVSYSEMEL